MDDALKLKITAGLKQDWSPEQICGRLKEKDEVNLHHETIYRFLLIDKKQKGVLYKHLRHQGKSIVNVMDTPTIAPAYNRIDIGERPEAVNKRGVFGHWEADTIIGKGHQGAIVTLDERISKLRMAYPVNSKQADKVAQAISDVLNPISEWVGSITYDNGKDFVKHEAVNKHLECLSYFAKPYHSWERGQNKNANGLLRQYFPKSMVLVDIAYEEVRIAVHKLNSRPRKCLGFKTPYEVFFENTGVDVSKLAVVHL